MTLGAALKALLAGGAVACVLLRPLLKEQHLDTVLLLAGIGAVWLFLAYRGVKSSRLAAASPFLIATGQFEQAEQHIDQALHSFTLMRSVKLLSLHHLAMLRHAQRRWQDAAALSRVLLKQRLGSLAHLSKGSRLILADALLELGDERGASEAIGGLYQFRLTLGEALNLMLLQLDQQHRGEQWEAMLQGLRSKVEMAELMPAEGAARAQALLGLAAKRQGCEALAHWLRARVELLTDVQKLAESRPGLWELWEQGNTPGTAGA